MYRISGLPRQEYTISIREAGAPRWHNHFGVHLLAGSTMGRWPVKSNYRAGRETEGEAELGTPPPLGPTLGGTGGSISTDRVLCDIIIAAANDRSEITTRGAP